MVTGAGGARLDGATARDGVILFRLLLIILVARQRTSRSCLLGGQAATSRSRTPTASIWSVVVLPTPSPLCPRSCHVAAPCSSPPTEAIGFSEHKHHRRSSSFCFSLFLEFPFWEGKMS
ncbi:hypothetical protein BS78_03G257100 [Paspalum vaginatum]|nr:hypothetical protein BS78_03G257100 [Paspalum vaginatum]KAJ1285138.1 hypothetical protein BS78_03G257100 [Paspalum vaginatum]